MGAKKRRRVMSYDFVGYTEDTRFNSRNFASHEKDQQQILLRVQVGMEKEFKEDVPVRVTVTVEEI